MLTLISASKVDNRDSFAVFDGEDCVGHIMRTQKSPAGKPWFWTVFLSGRRHSRVRVDRGYAATREQAMADFAVHLEDNRAFGIFSTSDRLGVIRDL